MTTLAAIDRIAHHSVILDLLGMDSYRTQEATAQHPQHVASLPQEAPAVPLSATATATAVPLVWGKRRTRDRARRVYHRRARG